MVEDDEKATSKWATAVEERTRNVLIVAIAQGTSDEIPVFKAPIDCEVTELGMIPEDAITGAATNNFTLGFKNKGNDGTGTDVIRLKVFSAGVNASAFEYNSFGTPLDATYKFLSEGDTVSFYKSEAGTGMAMPRLVAVLEYIHQE
jgi:hypothetical protein